MNGGLNIFASRPRHRPQLATRHRGLGRWHVVGESGEPDFENGWRLEPYGSAENPQVCFSLDDWGIVHIQSGMLVRDTGSGQTIFTLPAGFRPAQRLSIACLGSDTHGRDIDDIPWDAHYRGGRIDITATGHMIADPDAVWLAPPVIRFRRAPST